MPADFEQAEDEIQALFKAAWDAGADTAGVDVAWPNREFDVNNMRETDKAEAKSWARISIQHTGGDSQTIGAGNWRNEGLITIEIRVPGMTGNSLHRKMSKIAANAFRRKTTASGVRFQNVRPREVGNDGPWFRVDILAEFKYSEAVT